MMLRIYLRALLARVLRPRVTCRDVGAFMFGAVIPLAIWFVANESAGDLVRTGIIAGLALVVVLRAIIAPYDMWRELVLHVKELHREMDDDGPFDGSLVRRLQGIE